MKTDKLEETIELPSGVRISVDHMMLTAEGPKGKSAKPIIGPKLTVKQEGNAVKAVIQDATKREKTTMGTFKAHVKNMILGVTEGFTYKMKICSGHFPMTVAVKGDEVIVKNFLGEKMPRIVKMKSGVEVKVEGEFLVIKSVDRELAGQACASIEKLTSRSKYDKRVFQDGIYIIDKAGKEIK